MKRKKYWFLFAVLLLSLSSLSPSFDFTHYTKREPPGDEPVPPEQRPETPEADQGPIQVGVQLSGAELRKLNELNEQFMREYGAEVKIVPLESDDPDGEESLDAFKTQLSLGEGPDILLTDSHDIKALAVNGYLLPVDASQAVMPDGEALSGLLTPLQWNGYQWGLPFDIDPYVMVWNGHGKDGSSGELPRSRKEWKQYFGIHTSGAALSFDLGDPYAFAAAIHLMEGDPSKPDREALDLLLQGVRPASEITSDEQQVPGEGSEPSKEPGSLKIGPYSGFAGQDIDGRSLALAMGNDHPKSPVVRTRCLAVAAQTESSALAMKWITYMTGKEQQREWSKSAGTLPVLSELYVTSSHLLHDQGIWQKTAVPVQLLLAESEASVLDFGASGSFQTYAGAARNLLSGEITIEKYLELQPPESK